MFASVLSVIFPSFASILAEVVDPESGERVSEEGRARAHHAHEECDASFTL